MAEAVCCDAVGCVGGVSTPPSASLLLGVTCLLLRRRLESKTLAFCFLPLRSRLREADPLRPSDAVRRRFRPRVPPAESSPPRLLSSPLSPPSLYELPDRADRSSSASELDPTLRAGVPLAGWRLLRRTSAPATTISVPDPSRVTTRPPSRCAVTSPACHLFPPGSLTST